MVAVAPSRTARTCTRAAFWLAVNTISVALFASRGLTLTATLYAAYWINAWYGWWRWHRDRAQAATLLHAAS